MKTAPETRTFSHEKSRLERIGFGMEACPGDQIYHCQGPYIYYVSIIWTFSHPPTNYVSINTILDVSKIGHFLKPPTCTQPFCWRNIWMITSQSKCTGQDRYMYAHQCTCLSELRKIKYSKNNKKIIFFQFLFCWQQSSIGEGDSFYKTVWLTDSESSYLLWKYLRLIFHDNWNLSIKLDIKLIDCFVLEHSAFNISYNYNRC